MCEDVGTVTQERWSRDLRRGGSHDKWGDAAMTQGEEGAMTKGEMEQL